MKIKDHAPMILIAGLIVLLAGSQTQVFGDRKNSSESEGFLERSLWGLILVEIDGLNPEYIHHTHEKGELMLDYSASFRDGKGNRDGTSHVNAVEVLRDFIVSPAKLTMVSHMSKFLREDRKLHFEINLSAAKRDSLRTSSRFPELAKGVVE